MNHYALLVLDVDALICCNRHLSTHGCRIGEELERLKKDDESNKCLDTISEWFLIIAYAAESGVIAVIPNGGQCSSNTADAVSNTIGYIVQQCTSQAYSFAAENAASIGYEECKFLRELFSLIKVYDRDCGNGVDGCICYVLQSMGINKCLNIRSSSDCRTIEERVNCIANRIHSGLLGRKCGKSRITRCHLIFCYNAERAKQEVAGIEHAQQCNCGVNNVAVFYLQFTAQ